MKYPVFFKTGYFLTHLFKLLVELIIRIRKQMNIDIVKKEQAGIPKYHLTLPEVSARFILNETKAQEILNVIKDCLEDFSHWQQHSPNSTSRILSPEYNLPYIPEILFGSIGLGNLKAVIQERIFGVANAISDLEDSRNYLTLMFRAFFESESAKLSQLHDFLKKSALTRVSTNLGLAWKRKQRLLYLF